MAITTIPRILGQQIDGAQSYCYLYEPLEISIEDDDLTANKIFIDLKLINAATNVVEDTLIKFAEFDKNPGVPLSVDLMKIARQHNNAGVYRYSNVTDIANDTDGWFSVLGRFIYGFIIYNDTNPTFKQTKHKGTIIGGRSFQEFVPAVDENQKLTEFELLGITKNNDRWIGWPRITTALVSLDGADDRPIIEVVTPTVGEEVCGGYIIWKSRLGGWMHWGFDIETKTTTKRYKGQLQVGLFESTKESAGEPYVPVDYMGIDISYNITLKSLALSQLELEAVAGIAASPAVYYMKDQSGGIELMRLTSSSAPVDSNANGGDFSISLTSISRSSQNTI